MNDQHTDEGGAAAGHDASPRLVSLQGWIDKTFLERRPSIQTARRWARMGRINPQPVRHGRDYYVDLSAVYVPAPAQGDAK